MINATLVGVALTAILALTRWRWGLFLCVLVGLLQDPLRKLAPDQPVFFVVLVGVVFGGAWLGASLSKVRLVPNSMIGWKQHLGMPFRLFVALVLVQAFHTLFRHGTPMTAAVGLMIWLAPVLAVVFAYQWAARRSLPGVRAWMLFYCASAMVSLMGVYLQYLGFTWPSLGEVGPGLIIYDVGGILKAYSGFFRSSEIAAWHTATIGAFAFILFTARRLSGLRLAAAVAFLAVLVTLGLLTGRRKMLVEMALFVGVYVVLVAWFRHHSIRQALIAGALGLLAWGTVVVMVDPEAATRSRRQEYEAEVEGFRGYQTRGATAFAEIPNRFMEMGVAPVGWAINNFGFFGAGLGTGAQTGSGREAKRIVDAGAAEGGVGKITQELGVPGLILVGWLGIGMARYLFRVLTVTTRTSLPHARVAYGLLALLLAKLASFSVAAQVYSDLFVLLIMGWSLGFLLAMPGLAARAQAQRQAAANLAPGPQKAIAPHRGPPAWAR